MRLIYLDNASTTQISEQSFAQLKKFSTLEFFNPSAGYPQADIARQAVEAARTAIATRLGVAASTILFCSGATEANNLAIKSGFKNKKGSIIISGGEHPSVYETAKTLQNLKIAPLLPSGAVDFEAFCKLVEPDTTLVSIIHMSNETGAVNDIARLARFVKTVAPNAIFHSDGVQAFAKTLKMPANIDLYTMSAHKLGGAKGVGALYIKAGINLAPQILGGGQQNNRRAGTLNVPGIASFGAAVEALKPFDYAPLRSLLLECLPMLVLNGDQAVCHPSIVSLSACGQKAEVLLRRVANRGVVLGLGSACSSSKAGNRTLESMGLPTDRVVGAFRVSFAQSTTLDDIRQATKIIAEELKN